MSRYPDLNQLTKDFPRVAVKTKRNPEMTIRQTFGTSLDVEDWGVWSG